ncbi:GMC oxidoreductase [Paenibacillus cremeus]|uniref:LysM peptidoglycan-binding domain-containing protein n=1 Tax=Paenibacillus cremeus TaxID=2163881 RepID=A0A559KG76_9BACL|nr:GMC oxidoreductase [Paenibacillus cremeus]TVY11125.1 LysM peptidoglycan-binding domain-containing protein [Paenibacillus cremeus]
MKIHVADTGETLVAIARKYNLPMQELYSSNPHIAGPDLILTGQIVKLPDSSLRPDLPITVPVCPPLIPPKTMDQWVPLTPLTDMEKHEYDVLIIGTGAGGGAALWRFCDRLRKSGKRIGVIERGNLLLPTHAYNVPTLGDWGHMLEYWLNPNISNLIGNSLPQFSGAVEVFALGGRTLFWSGTTPRFPASEFVHWPISYKELEPYYNIAEQALKVSRSMTAFKQYYLNRFWEQGFPEAEASPQAIARGTTDVYFSSIQLIGEALHTRPFDLAVNARAVRIITERGKVGGIEVRGPQQESVFLRAKNVVVAASTFETPRLLLYSGIPGKAIGHYLINHTFFRVHGTTTHPDGRLPGDGFMLIPQTEYRPYLFQILPVAETEVEFDVFGTVESRYENFLYLDRNRRDAYGVPEIQVRFSYSAEDMRLIDETRKAIDKVASIMQIELTPAGGKPAVCLVPPGADYHESGTCRMGEDPNTSVVDRNGQVHGISGLYVADNSVLPSIGATNPTLTTAALAIRTADHIIRMLDG